MSFLSSILPALGGIAGSFFGLPGAAIGSAIGSGLGGAFASNDAASAQNQASQNAQDTQWRMFQQNQQQLAPWQQGGQNANQALMAYLGIGPNGQFNQNAPGVAPFDASMLPGDPSYKWRVQQGENALLNNASALGTTGSGNTMKSLVNYGQNAASQQYQQALANYQQQQANVTNRLSGVSNTGVNAAGNVAGLGAATAGNVSGLQYAQGQANAGGILGGQNALVQGTAGGINNWLLASAMQQGQTPQNAYYQPLNMGPQQPDWTSGFDLG